MRIHSNSPIVVIADDFTGAAEIAGIGFRYGLRSEVQTAFDPATDSRLIVIDSDTRAENSEDAAHIVSDLTKRLQTLSTQLIYKKTDSVLRGHVTTEINAMAGILGKDRAVLVPANPDMGRMIQCGLYLIDGVRLHHTDFACDPEFPARSSKVTALLGASGRLKVQSLSEPVSITQGTLVIGDVTSTDDLAGWASNVSSDCLPAGGGEFFAAILKTLGYREQVSQSEDGEHNGPSLFVTGSMSGYSRETVEQARSHGMPVFTVPHEHRSSAFDELSASINKAIGTYGSAMLTVADDIPATMADPRKIPEVVAEAVERILCRQQVNSLYLTGGATAGAVLHRLGWKRFVTEAELGQGVCLMRVMEQDNRHVIVKPGSYPWPDSLVHDYFGG